MRCRLLVSLPIATPALVFRSTPYQFRDPPPLRLQRPNRPRPKRLVEPITRFGNSDKSRISDYWSYFRGGVLGDHNMIAKEIIRLAIR
jgi:hypothetical protein